MQSTIRKVLCAPGAAENPYQSRLARELAPLGYQLRLRPLAWRVGRERRFDECLLHLHWLAPLLHDPRRARTTLRLALFARQLHQLRKRGVPLVWTVHNLYAHECQHPGPERQLRRWLARNASALIVHGKAAAERVRLEYGVPDRTDVAIIPHGHYIDSYPTPPTKAEARQRLGLAPEAPILLFLGQIRAYKGVQTLISVARRVRPGLQLVVAGRPNHRGLEDELRALARDEPSIHLRLDFVPDEEVPVLFAACDVFVLPSREVLTSGSAVLAMSFGRVCLAPRNGCFTELLTEAGAFLYDPGGLEGALRTALAERERWEDMGQRNRDAIEPFGWDRVASQTAEVYARVLGSAAST